MEEDVEGFFVSGNRLSVPGRGGEERMDLWANWSCHNVACQTISSLYSACSRLQLQYTLHVGGQEQRPQARLRGFLPKLYFIPSGGWQTCLSYPERGMVRSTLLTHTMLKYVHNILISGCFYCTVPLFLI